MAKFYGSIGYGETTETSPGVWEEVITERKYFGDVLQFTRRWENGQGLNDDLNISNKISIVADPFAYEHFHTMRYAEWLGAKWKVSSVEVAYPRLILNIGGVYNEQQA
ncbi:MAG: hypothetical protein LUD81_05590 [Clostridiales bacterium]|nr:hypothetical protein [Clostridiales bacterium]